MVTLRALPRGHLPQSESAAARVVTSRMPATVHTISKPDTDKSADAAHYKAMVADLNVQLAEKQAHVAGAEARLAEAEARANAWFSIIELYRRALKAEREARQFSRRSESRSQ